MLLAGDELSHSQKGNNNTYCQDNELTWLNWDLQADEKAFFEFVKQVALLHQTQPVFQRRKFFLGRAIRGSDIQDLSWFGADGKEMSDEAWGAGFKGLGMRLEGSLIGDVDERGEKVEGETLLVLLNAHFEGISFTLPETPEGTSWERILETAAGDESLLVMNGGQQFSLEARSSALLRRRLAAPEPAVTDIREPDQKSTASLG